MTQCDCGRTLNVIVSENISSPILAKIVSEDEV